MDEREPLLNQHGLGVLMAAIFLTGEMAGSGVLKLPAALVGTGWAGAAIIFVFTINSCYCGTRLGLCTNILAERYEELRHEIRDPYPSIGEKTFGRVGRMTAIVCMIISLWGSCCVFMSLIAGMINSLLGNIDGFDALEYKNCAWMAIVAAFLIPLTWMGTPKDFWPVAVGALLSTVTACICVIVQAAIDHNAYVIKDDNGDDGTCEGGEFVNGTGCEPIYPAATVKGFFTAFSTIMYAFGGSSTFPTIQADMKDRSKFPISAMIGCSNLFLIYLPFAATGYYCYGDAADDSIIDTVSCGGLRITAEVCIIVHLVSAFVIYFNPPTQYFEQLLNIPSNFNLKRIVFRTVAVLLLLFISESIPDFGNILDIVGATAITLMTFICPPLFYMKLCDTSDQNSAWTDRRIPILQRIYCWFLILLGVIGGTCATYAAIHNIVSAKFSKPCYVSCFE